jgi:hypothetical protein
MLIRAIFSAAGLLRASDGMTSDAHATPVLKSPSNSSGRLAKLSQRPAQLPTVSSTFCFLTISLKIGIGAFAR